MTYVAANNRIGHKKGRLIRYRHLVHASSKRRVLQHPRRYYVRSSAAVRNQGIVVAEGLILTCIFMKGTP
jgi:hypothetical protein